MTTIRQKVWQALNAAQADGYNCVEEQVEIVAHELQNRDSDLEWRDTQDLYQHIIAWQGSAGGV